ncbi:MAG: glycosyltransferase family 4 protein [Polyangiales bacterium]
MAEVLFVSKPVAPPWNDSSKNLVRDVAGHLQRHRPVLMHRSRLGILAHLLLGPPSDIWHFFFAPNLKTSTAGRLACAIRRIPSVHTLCSMPSEGSPTRRLLFADLTVALSRATHQRLRGDGVSDAVLRIIPPCVPMLPQPTELQRTGLREKHGLPAEASIWIYPGDLEFGGGAEIALQGFAAWNRSDSVLLMACRRKTPQSDEALFSLRDRARRWGIAHRVRWLGETPQIHELLALSDVVVMLNPSPYAKMDYPLVVLESMCLGRPVIVGKATPSAELADDGGALATETNAEALAGAVERLSTDEDSRVQLGRNARALATSKFSPHLVAAAYERLYEEILA